MIEYHPLKHSAILFQQSGLPCWTTKLLHISEDTRSREQKKKKIPFSFFSFFIFESFRGSLDVQNDNGGTCFLDHNTNKGMSLNSLLEQKYSPSTTIIIIPRT